MSPITTSSSESDTSPPRRFFMSFLALPRSPPASLNAWLASSFDRPGNSATRTLRGLRRFHLGHGVFASTAWGARASTASAPSVASARALGSLCGLRASVQPVTLLRAAAGALLESAGSRSFQNRPQGASSSRKSRPTKWKLAIRKDTLAFRHVSPALVSPRGSARLTSRPAATERPWAGRPRVYAPEQTTHTTMITSFLPPPPPPPDPATPRTRPRPKTGWKRCPRRRSTPSRGRRRRRATPAPRSRAAPASRPSH